MVDTPVSKHYYSEYEILPATCTGVEMDSITLGLGFPLVGRPGNMAGLNIAVTHSAMKLAPVLGLFAAGDRLTGVRDSLLGGYEPDWLWR